MYKATQDRWKGPSGENHKVLRQQSMDKQSMDREVTEEEGTRARTERNGAGGSKRVNDGFLRAPSGGGLPW
jgi:hypothetical protein